MSYEEAIARIMMDMSFVVATATSSTRRGVHARRPLLGSWDAPAEVMDPATAVLCLEAALQPVVGFVCVLVRASMHACVCMCVCVSAYVHARACWCGQWPGV